MRISVCSKEPIFREALASLLNHEGKFDVVAQEDGARSCITAAKAKFAQVIVLDGLGLEGNDIQFLMGARAFGDFGIVLLTDDSSEEYDPQSIDAIVKRAAGAIKLFEAVRKVGSGFLRPERGRPRTREKRAGYGAEFNLTEREYEVASLIAKGYSNRRISEETKLQEQSIKNLVSVIMRKLRCENRTQVALQLVHASVGTQEVKG